MTELEEKTAKAIERLKAFEPKEGYYLAFSGGKDSVVCKALCDMAGVKYDAHYRLTSVDPPELVQFIRQEHPDVEIEKPRYPDDFLHEEYRGKQITMWNLILLKGVPTRRLRFCCNWLKESGGDGRMTITGVRWAESTNRRKNQGVVTVLGEFGKREISGEIRESEHFAETNKGGIVLVNDNEESRRLVEQCYTRNKITLNPIIDWTDRNVWDFIMANKVKYCSLYDEGWTRIGCIGCPMATRREKTRQFLRYPKYKEAYLRTFGKMLARYEQNGKRWGGKAFGEDIKITPDLLMRWWCEEEFVVGQMSFDDLEEEDE